MKKLTGSVYVAAGVSLAIALILLVGMLAGGVLVQAGVNSPVQAATLPQTASDSDLMGAFEQSMVKVYQDTLPSVVSIRVTQSAGIGDLSGILPKNHPEFFNQGSGTGFVWDDQGHIVTNNHVVDKASQIEVYFADDTWAKAKLVGTDPDSDLAVIKVDLPAGKLKPVTLGDSSKLKVGQMAIAIGNPFGQEFTMTSGIISGIGRIIRGGNSGFSIPEAIQTDASINPGNSGGPLLNRQGEVIGINAQMMSESGSSAGIGFAIPVNIAKSIVPGLISGKSHEYAWLGISGGDVTPALAEFRKLGANVKGAVVISTMENSPAAAAGIKGRDESLAEDSDGFRYGGDIITAIDGTPINNIDDLVTYLVDKTQPGDKVKLDVIHNNGKTATVTVTLGKRPHES